MPATGITVYAKWIQNQYRVFLHPNVPSSDTTLNWGSETQEMTFRVSSGAKVSLPTGTRLQYELVGWYTDENCTTPYNESMVLNDTTVTTDYDKTTAYTDPMDKYGEIGANPSNSDLTGANGRERFWITKRLDLYAKWRAIIIGADGIGVRYVANGKDAVSGDAIPGTNAPNDTSLYLDQAEAVAQNASTSGDEDYHFLYWVVQDWDDARQEYVDTDIHVYPGDNFTIEMDYAQAVELDGSTDDDPRFSYTMQLRAEYGPKDSPTPTHLTWYDNYTTNPVEGANYITDPDLQINEAVLIEPATTFTRSGYKFIGWARVEATADGSLSPRDLDEDDLFLKWTGSEFQAEIDGAWQTVTRVAGDEKDPYHDLYAVWEANSVVVEKATHVTGQLNPNLVDHTIYFVLQNHDTGAYVTDGSGNVVYQTITITNGVPSPSSVEFTDIPNGNYDVWECRSVSGSTVDRLAPGIIFGTGSNAFQLYSIVGTHLEADGTTWSSGNNAIVRDGSEGRVKLDNTYGEVKQEIEFVVNKKWMNRTAGEISAPDGAKVTIGLYRKTSQDANYTLVTSVELDGTVDTTAPTTAGGYESAAWKADFIHLPNVDDNGYEYTYVVREDVKWPGFYPYRNQTQNGNPMADTEFFTTNGGTIWNRDLRGTVVIQKHFDFQPNDGDLSVGYVQFGNDDTTRDILDFTLTGPDGYSDNFTLKDGTSREGRTYTWSWNNNTQYYLYLTDMEPGTYTVTEHDQEHLLEGYNYYLESVTPTGGTTTQTFDINTSMSVPQWNLTNIHNQYRFGAVGQNTLKLKKTVSGLTADQWNTNRNGLRNIDFYITRTTESGQKQYLKQANQGYIIDPDTGRMTRLRWTTNKSEAAVFQANNLNYNQSGSSYVTGDITLNNWPSLEVGTYTLEEVDESIAGLDWTVSGGSFEIKPQYKTVNGTKLLDKFVCDPEVIPVTNNYSLANIDVPVSKTVVDNTGATDASGLKFAFTATLDGTNVFGDASTQPAGVTLNADRTQATFKLGHSETISLNVPIGAVLTVTETTLDAYTTASAAGTVTGTNTIDYTVPAEDPETVAFTNTRVMTDITVQKVWDDENDKYGLRPATLVLTLYKDGAATSTTSTLDGTADTAPADPTAAYGYESGAWEVTFGNLPAHSITVASDGTGTATALTYTVAEENAPSGYEVSGTPAGDDGTITNTLTTVDVPVVKVVVNDNYTTATAFGFSWTASAPSGVSGTTQNGTFTLTPPTGTKTAQTTVTVPLGWSLNVSETSGNTGYDTTTQGTGDAQPTKSTSYSYTAVEATPKTITFTNYIQKEITVTKAWVDNSDELGVRPSDLTLTLLQNNTAMTGAPDPTIDKTTDTDNWTYTWTGLPAIDASGSAYAYTVDELDEPTYYTVSGNPASDGGTITNTLPTVEVPVEKIVEDEYYTSTAFSFTVTGGLPASFELTPSASGASGKATRNVKVPVGATLTVTETPNAAYDTTVQKSGDTSAAEASTITYADVPATDPATITFTNTRKTTDITVTKAWDDNSDELGVRPTDLTLTLKQNDTAMTDAPAPTIDKTTDTDNWTYTWTGLPEIDANGDAYTYTVDELTVPTYYTVSGNPASDGDTITNTLPTVEVPVEKIVEDEYYTLTAFSFTVTGGLPESFTLTPSAAGASGKVTQNVKVPVGATLTVTETANPAYDTTVQKTGDTSAAEASTITYANVPATNPATITFTNTRKTTDITVTKAWVDNSNELGVRPSELTLTLLQNGSEMTGAPDPTIDKTTDTDNWTYTWTGLPAIDASGSAYAYTVDELDVPTYYTVSGNPASDGDTITNTLPTVEVPVEKIVEDEYYTSTAFSFTVSGGLPESFTLTPSAAGATGKATQNVKVPVGVTLTVAETANAAYDTTVQKTGDASATAATTITYADVPATDPATITFTNTRKTTDITVTKAWDDNSNELGVRPTDLTLTLLQNGSEMTGAPTPTIDKTTDTDNWTYTWTGLPAIDASGNAYTYTVDELTVPTYYTVSGNPASDGGTITNTLPTVEVPVEKIVEDEYYTSTAFSFTVSGGLPESFTLTPSAAGASGKVTQNVKVPVGATLTVTETANPAYDTTVQKTGDTSAAEASTITYENVPATDPATITFTNTRKLTTVTVTKAWDDESDRFGLRPTYTAGGTDPLNMTLNPAAEGATKTITVNDDDTWTYTWENVPEKDNTGADIDYTMTETLPSGTTYTTKSATASAGGTITNSLPTSSLTVTKEVTGNLGDVNNQFSFTLEFTNGTAPDTLTATKAGETVTLTKNSAGKYEFTLAHQESLKIDGLPSGLSVKITENDTDYTTKINDGAEIPETGSKVAELTMAGNDMIVKFTNDRTIIIDTGVSVDYAPYVAIMGTALAGLAALLYRRRRRIREA